VNVATDDWLTDELVEPLAMAICFGGFHDPNDRDDDARRYWAGVVEDARNEYRRTAKALLRLVASGCRVAEAEASDVSLGKYMAAMRLSNKTNARRHFAEMYRALPTIWQRFAQAGEAGTAETGTGSVHDPATPQSGDAP
jgi:hypothetical protein